jgi:hypothetical protein
MFSMPLVYRLQILPANGKQGLVPEEMSQPLITNKKQEKLCLRDATNIIKPIELSINLNKFFYFNIKSEEPIQY